MSVVQKHSKKIKLVAAGAVSGATLVGVLFFIDPNQKSLVYILLPVLLFWLTLFCILEFIGSVVLQRTSRLYTIINGVCTTSLVLLLLLSGVGQVSIAEVILVGGLTASLGFYINRTWF